MYNTHIYIYTFSTYIWLSACDKYNNVTASQCSLSLSLASCDCYPHFAPVTVIGGGHANGRLNVGNGWGVKRSVSLSVADRSHFTVGRPCKIQKRIRISSLALTHRRRSYTRIPYYISQKRDTWKERTKDERSGDGRDEKKEN